MALIPFTHPGSGENVPRELPESLAHSDRSRRRQLVLRAISLLRQHAGERVTIATLSRVAGVSDRTLRAAFHDVVGLSPKQYKLAQRLRAAREALLSAHPSTTVTDVATEHGFYELGQFAVRYRQAFGEVPSRTLQQAAARSPWEAA